MLRTNIRRLRRAFTLVELMVAMALAIGIMWILAESFKMGLDLTRHAHATGSMMTQLDGARAVLARDLLADHFLADPNKPNGGVKLSDQRLDLLTNGGTGWYPPTGGFFRIISPYSNQLTPDTDGYNITQASTHALHFTAVLPANDQNLYTADAPVGGGKTYTSRAAEVAYFLVDSGLRTTPGPTGQTLYHLVRRQRLAALTPDERSSLMPSGGAAWAATDSTYTEVIAGDGTNTFTLSDLTNPSNRLPIAPTTPLPAPSGTPLQLSGARYGEDLLLSNVLSFEVLVDWGPNPFIATSGQPARAAAVGNWDWPYDALAVNPGQNTTYQNQGVFDTWSAVANWNNFGLMNNTAALPLAVRVKGLQITVRVFDPKTKQARQSTWKFSM